jgi:hypothetical protein
MIQANAAYGRYVDDMRLFGNSRQEVLQNLRILQEQLLRKGLNLNSSKTEIAEDQQSRDLLMSRVPETSALVMGTADEPDAIPDRY